VNEEYKPVTSWAPIVGRWDFESARRRATYRGPQLQTPAPFGICVSNVRFSEGKAEVKVRLPAGAADAIHEDASAYLLLGYRSPSDEYYLAGLAGYRSAYTITHFDPSFGWRGLALAGSRDNLRPDQPYQVTLHVQGQNVNLEVDGIRVLDFDIPTPIPSGQLGLLAWGSGGVEFLDTGVFEKPGKIFVVMEFSKPYQELYKDVIHPMSKRFRLEAYHAGEVYGPGVILDDMSRESLKRRSSSLR
jgi:hypothetical protein